MKFSVITPSYNQGKYIRATVESVLAQAWPDLEYLVMDGGSSDETVSVLRSYGSRLAYVSQRDRGTADAINGGLQRTTGGLIGWLNSDDVYYAGALHRVAQLFADHPEVDVIYGKAHHIDEEGRILEVYPTEDFSYERLLQTCFISQPAAFFRRRVVDRHGPLEVHHRYCVDYEFWIRLAKGGCRFLHVPEFFAATRLHSAAKTVASRLQCHEDINEIMLKHVGGVPSGWISNYAHVRAENFADRGRDEAVFLTALVWHCLLADWRWNRRVTREVVAMIAGWVRGRLGQPA